MAARLSPIMCEPSAAQMPSAFIVKRGEGPKRRFVVRFSLGGRAWPIEHGGSFKTDREARIRRDLIAGELAAGRNPRRACCRD